MVESVAPDDMVGGEAFTAHASRVLAVLMAVLSHYGIDFPAVNLLKVMHKYASAGISRSLFDRQALARHCDSCPRAGSLFPCVESVFEDQG